MEERKNLERRGERQIAKKESPEPRCSPSKYFVWTIFK